ncbi:MAG: hypothetical protein ABI824_13690 [Acidobacteriota bacterium]
MSSLTSPASPVPSTPVSVPKPRPLPDAVTYGFAELALFSQFSRDSYRASFGVDPLPYDATRLTKSWFDSTADTSHPENVSVYRILAQDSTGQWGMRQMVIPSAEAATVNLPGEVTYPTYVVAPTATTRGGSGINPVYLSLESDALALMVELGGSDLGLEDLMGFPTTYPAQESRRLWYFLLSGRAQNVGNLLYSKNWKGVGAPGHWDLSLGSPVWVLDPAPISGLNDTRPPRDMPVRDLYTDEKFQVGLMGTTIIRIDLQDASNEAGGQFSPQDRVVLQQIFEAVARIENGQRNQGST